MDLSDTWLARLGSFDGQTAPEPLFSLTPSMIAPKPFGLESTTTGWSRQSCPTSQIITFVSQL